ncbi:succinate dehydrogenase, cytochrome b556 subunit [Achromobacter sp. GG226]|uniref:succinate dehydrogenase, cytochrome b556 subunit n=1 Tax=Verticiella alkaliphila TaxID=2779529 RepID=UPI001C0DFF14|nr:succinate dehydrogenase, cytochrome b556 subunit [Verticiella sp. GG226]MBU4612269.1 succinate dehydrogenase, cytochrome b556 subunit [Verticiella sp. GG226]
MSNTTATPAARPRKEFRNITVPQILSYRLPLAGKLSILHRVSGALLFLALPVLLLPLFQMSVSSPAGFEGFRAFAAHPISKLVLLVLIWAYLHHFCAGIRYLLLDLHMGMTKEGGKRSAGIVFVVSLALTAVFALKLFGAF